MIRKAYNFQGFGCTASTIETVKDCNRLIADLKRAKAELDEYNANGNRINVGERFVVAVKKVRRLPKEHYSEKYYYELEASFVNDGHQLAVVMDEIELVRSDLEERETGVGE